MRTRTCGRRAVRRCCCWLALVVAPRPESIAQADLPFAKAETVGMSSKRLERINAFIKDYIDTNQIAGAVTLVARKGKIVHFESQGWRYKEENQPMEKDAIFSLASMTKPIVSTALMMLWEDGKFMLDDPISKWLPSYANKQVLDPLTGRRMPARPVTVRHVLSHTSGLSLTPSAGPEPAHRRPDVDAMAIRSRPAQAAGRRAAEDAARSDRARRRHRRSRFSRASAGSTGRRPISSRILVEKMSGMTIDEFVRTQDLPAARHARHLLQRAAGEGRARSPPSTVPTKTARSRCCASRSTASRRPISRASRAERHGGRLLPVLADAAERRRVQRPAAARPHDRQHDDHQSDRRRQAGVHPRRRLRLRPRLRRPHGSGEVARRAVDRHASPGAAPTARCSGSIRRRISSAS